MSALGRLTEEDDSDDPEEQKRKHEAAQSASNVGAILSLTIGAIETFTQNNQSLTRPQDEEQQIEGEEEFNEFLARMDEEYEYEEQQQIPKPVVQIQGLMRVRWLIHPSAARRFIMIHVFPGMNK